MIDTHAHLDPEEAPAQLERARVAGVARVLVVGTTLPGCREALGLADEHDGLFAVLGLHPHGAGSVQDGDVAELGRLFDHPRAVAVGETGLDFFRDYAPHDAQRTLFERQLALARELGKPVVIHTRAADEATLEGLSAARGHGRPALLLVAEPPRPGARAGVVRLVRGQRHVPKAEELRAAAARVPEDRLLAETDAPYLAPQPVRGRRNEPAHVVHTLATLAEVRGVPAAELGAQIDANASACFGLP